MKREKVKNRLLGTFFLVLGVLLVLVSLATVLAAVSCFDSAWHIRELYPWAVSEAEPGWESAMNTLEERQGKWFLGGILLLLWALCALAVGIFLAHRGRKRWREGKNLKTELLSGRDVARAAAILRAGGLVAIPTETVYGLGADGLNPAAVERIFAAKGRPQDNPLILHVPDDSWLRLYCRDIPETAYALTRRFWPGPLTLILPRKEVVPDVVTAGLDTVGVRCPDHPLTRTIIEAAEVPVAAPSANTSGKPSPTTAAHVLADMDGKIDAVVDGGPCSVGVESTIVDLTCTPPRLLRPGGVTLEQLRDALGEVAVDKAVVKLLDAGEKPRAPGMKYRHYAPEAPVTVVKGDPGLGAAYIRAHLKEGGGVICFDEYAPLFDGYPVRSIGPAGDKAEQARRIFDALRAFDATEVTEIFAQCPDEGGIGLAVANRLNKAAGFHIVRV